jgi:hypothetical protein
MLEKKASYQDRMISPKNICIILIWVDNYTTFSSSFYHWNPHQSFFIYRDYRHLGQQISIYNKITITIFLICSHPDIVTGFINFEMKLSLDYKNIIAKIQNDKV